MLFISILITISSITGLPSFVSGSKCNNTNANLATCNFNTSCVYGEPTEVYCNIGSELSCEYLVTFDCLYCWQLPEEDYSCSSNVTCELNSRYLSICTVSSKIYCLGHREFPKYKLCKPTLTKKEKTCATVLSYLFGGFGIDRFYLGHWQEGIGKMFSFGGFGIWTLIDAILINIGFIK